MFTVKDYCVCCRNDAYGGSIELVDAGIEALINELHINRYESANALCMALEKNVDAILSVSTSVLPLINLLIKVLNFTRTHAYAPDAYTTAAKAIELLDQHRLEQKQSTKNIGAFGSRLIPQGGKLGTFSTSGSVMAALEQAVRDGKKFSAVCFEARPHNEGYRTLKEIAQLGIQTKLGVDALLCCLIPKCDLFMIGADAITATGDVYAKTGSYPAALACREFGVPFYVAADTSKFDAMSRFGFPLKDSARPSSEVTDESFPQCAAIENISFELIPPNLIKGVITEKGVVPPVAYPNLAASVNIDAYVMDKLVAWLNADRQY